MRAKWNRRIGAPATWRQVVRLINSARSSDLIFFVVLLLVFFFAWRFKRLSPFTHFFYVFICHVRIPVTIARKKKKVIIMRLGLFLYEKESNKIRRRSVDRDSFLNVGYYTLPYERVVGAFLACSIVEIHSAGNLEEKRDKGPTTKDVNVSYCVDRERKKEEEEERGRWRARERESGANWLYIYSGRGFFTARTNAKGKKNGWQYTTGRKGSK